MRIATCPHVLDKTDIEAAGRCPIALAARCNRLQALPMRDPTGVTPKKAKALLSDEQRLMGEESEGSDMENAGELASEDSASEGEPLSECDDCQKGDGSQPSAVKAPRAWTRLYRQGLCSDGWLPVLQALCPNIIVICVLTSSGYGAPALFSSGVSRHKGD